MTNKDRMLDYIQKTKSAFMNTNTSVELVPYYKLTDAQYQAIKTNFSSVIDSKDIVCLISTSIMSIGKTGIVFTEAGVYTKAWGILTSCYYNAYSDAQKANFGTSMDIDAGSLRKVMGYLYEIYCDEKKRAAREQKVEGVTSFLEGTLSAMEKGVAFLEKINKTLSDEKVKEKTPEEKRNETGLGICKLFEKELSKIREIMKEFDENGSFSDERGEELIDNIKAVFAGIFANMMVLAEDIEEIMEEMETESQEPATQEWIDNIYDTVRKITFWGYLFHYSDAFEKNYTDERLQQFQATISDAIQLADELLNDDEELFKQAQNFSEKLIKSVSIYQKNAKNEEEMVDALQLMLTQVHETVEGFKDLSDNAFDALQELFPG